MDQARGSLLHVAAAASAIAGLVHAAAAGSHSGLPTLATLFGLTAIAQVGWAALAHQRSDVSVAVAGLVIHGGAIATWILSRTVGISFVDGLDGPQVLGLQDGLAVGLESVAVIAALVAVARPALGTAARPVVPAFAALMLAAAVPAMTTQHDHGSHDHDATDVVLAAGATDDAHGHGDGHEHDDGHDHGDDGDAPGDDVVAAAADVPYPVEFVDFLDTAETIEERAAAEKLLVETTEAMKAFPDEAAVQAAGFVSIGDGGTGWEHYIHVGRIANPAVLDPTDIESIVMKVNPDGTKQVASAMYLLPFGTTMADAPDIAGDLTPWHDHQNLCWDGARVVGTTDATGSCQRGEFRPTQPMIHVWMIPHECGPFAGIEGSHGDGCAHEH